MSPDDQQPATTRDADGRDPNADSVTQLIQQAEHNRARVVGSSTEFGPDQPAAELYEKRLFDAQLPPTLGVGDDGVVAQTIVFRDGADITSTIMGVLPAGTPVMSSGWPISIMSLSHSRSVAYQKAPTSMVPRSRQKTRHDLARNFHGFMRHRLAGRCRDFEWVRRGSAFDTGERIEAHYDAAVTVIPRDGLILLYLYLLWFRGFMPRPIDHGFVEYLIPIFGAIFLWGTAQGLIHLVAWLRLEAKGMEYGFTAAGPAAGSYRVSRRLSDDKALLDPHTRAQRESMEIGVALQRRKEWMLAMAALASSAVGTFFAYAYEPWIGWAAAVIALGPSVAWSLRMNIAVLAYNSGAQFIPGAKVIEAEPPKPGLADVVRQKAHGDARLASEAETLAAATGGGPRRASIHDQEF